MNIGKHVSVLVVGLWGGRFTAPHGRVAGGDLNLRRPDVSFLIAPAPRAELLAIVPKNLLTLAKKILSYSARSILLRKLVNWAMSANTFGTFRRKTKTAARRPDEWPGR